MFKIPNHDAFTTTIGKLNFFRWALETRILDYIEAHEEEIRQGYNAYLKETLINQKRNKIEGQRSPTSSTASSTASSDSIGSMNDTRITRRRMKQTPSSLTKLQVCNTAVELSFD
jgi:hypothetical protein